jgi:uncharacterized protein YecE (DUF72 family)
MKFGKLEDVSQVDFTLPPDPVRTVRVLGRQPQPPDSQPRIHLGATGWANKEWLGTWYPARAKSLDFLTHYCRLFDTIELNTTHYRIPEATDVERWRTQAQASGKFAFCPKVPQLISHHTRLRADESTLRFAEVMRGLGQHLGPCFIQLPDHHGPGDIRSIREFLKVWPQEVGLCWELRHPEWFAASEGPFSELLDALEGAGHGMVITDVAGRRDVLHMQLTTPVLMLRFIGNQLHPSDFARADAWIARITDWCGKGLQAAYIFIHQHEMDLVPEFTAYWARGLNKSLGLKITVPEPIRMDVQGSLF